MSAAPTPVDPERERSPRRAMCAAVLSLEAIAVGLSTPVMIGVSGIRAGVALPVGLGLALACVLVAGMLRRESAYVLGHALQVGAVALGLLAPLMFVVAGIFALLWGTAYGLGRKIERERAEAFSAYDRQREL
ncbi:DUF4233 domain-containing protein [Nocardioides sp. R1-1]|uniref:DUF4233 domain-containing protein n=1 Tax=Nocardioides sp. R1-1 TaxID=3383502 RepID=UPI0038D01E06